MLPPPTPSDVQILGEGRGGRARGRRPASRAGGAGPMILVLSRPTSTARPSRSRSRRSPSPATSPPRAAACPSTRSSSASCPTTCARSWRRTASAPCTASAATASRRTPAPAGPRRSCRSREPARSVVVMAAGTDRGNELMAHVAARAGVAMAANVLSFHGLSPFVVTRQVVGGAALEEMRLDQRPAVFTVAGHAVEADAGRRRPAPPTSSSSRPRSPPRTWWRGWSRPRSPRPTTSGALKSARVVVGAGRGAGGPDGFGDVLELTELLGGALGRLPRGHQRRLAPAPRAGRPDRQPDLPGPLHPVRHQRRHPALGRLRVAPRPSSRSTPTPRRRW